MLTINNTRGRGHQTSFKITRTSIIATRGSITIKVVAPMGLEACARKCRALAKLSNMALLAYAEGLQGTCRRQGTKPEDFDWAGYDL